MRRRVERNEGGRPRLAPTVIVRIGKAEYELTFGLVKLPRDTPFREVYLALVRQAEREKE